MDKKIAVSSKVLQKLILQEFLAV